MILKQTTSTKYVMWNTAKRKICQEFIQPLNRNSWFNINVLVMYVPSQWQSHRVHAHCHKTDSPHLQRYIRSVTALKAPFNTSPTSHFTERNTNHWSDRSYTASRRRLWWDGRRSSSSTLPATVGPVWAVGGRRVLCGRWHLTVWWWRLNTWLWSCWLETEVVITYYTILPYFHNYGNKKCTNEDKIPHNSKTIIDSETRVYWFYKNTKMGLSITM